jgi:GNAT superfamily N-acetyltransferase
MRSSVELDVSPPLELERMAGGELVAIRTADRGDEALLRELALDLARTRRQARHLGWMNVVNRIPRQLQPLTRLESLEECLVAIDPRDGRPIGMASTVASPDDPSAAAPWVTVRDGLRRRGVGTALLERLAARARLHGHDRFRLRMVVSEQRMLELMRRVGVPCRPVRSLREVEAEIPLPGADGLGVALGAALWAVARGGLSPTVPRS